MTGRAADLDPAVDATAEERITDALVRLDPDWRIVEVNGRGAALLGRAAADLRGRVVWDVFPAVRETDLPGALHEAVETGRPRTVEVPHRTRGTRLEAHVLPTGEGVTLTVHERSSDARPDGDRARMVALSDRPAFAVDGAGRCVDANTAFADALDRDRADLLGDRVTEEIEGIASALRTAIAARDPVGDDLDPEHPAVETVEVTLRAGTVDRRRYEARVAPADDEGAVCVLRDRSIPEGRRQRLAVLDRVLRHNLRTEMNVIQGRLRTVADAVDDPDAADAVDAIEGSVDDLLSVSRDVRRFADALDPAVGDPQPYDATHEIQGVVTDVRRRYPEADVRYVVRDDVQMCAHESALVAVEELLENAVEHGSTGSQTPSGDAVEHGSTSSQASPDDAVEHGSTSNQTQSGDAVEHGSTGNRTGSDDAVEQTDDVRVRVTVSAVETDRGPCVRVEVADNGDGIPEPERAVLVGGEETPLDHASGVGLWMVNWAAHKSGGELSFSSPEGWGSVVTLDLPRPLDGDC